MLVETANPKTWIKAARYHALPQVILPCFLGGLVALSHGQFNPLLFVITLVGLAIVGLGTFLLDDYFDYRAGSTFIREETERGGMRTRMGKCYYILDGTLRLEDVFRVGAGCFIIGAIICIYLTVVSGWMVLALSVAGALICYFYSAPPLKLCYHGLGEISVALTMGPMIAFGSYYVLAQNINLEPIIVSIAVGVLIGNILYVHSIMDFGADKALGKNTLAVALGSQERAIKALPLIFLVSYGSIVLGVVTKVLHPILLIALLTIPMAIKLIQLMNLLQNNVIASKTKQPGARWMGPMERFDEIQKAGIGWFMVRWYLARNLFMATTALIFVGYILILLQ